MTAAPVPYFPDPPKRPRPKAKAKRRKPRAKKVCQKETPAATPVVGTLLPQAHGGALRIGNPGNKGRPPDEMRERFRAILAHPDAEALLTNILQGRAFTFNGAYCEVSGELYLRAHAYAMERGYGKAAPETELQADPTKPRQLIVRMIHELKAG